jgi:hypothetical protein
MTDPKLLPPENQAVAPALDPVRFLHDHPLICLGIAAGVGYVVGGGLFTPFTARVIGVGAKAVVLPTLKKKMNRFTQE